MSDLLTIKDLQIKWGCSRSYIDAAIRRGSLDVYRLGGLKVRADDAEVFWLNNPTMPTTNTDPSTPIELELGFPVRLVRRSERNKPVVYFIKTTGHDFVKIGF